VSGDEDHRQRQLAPAQLIEEFQSAHAGHAHVEQHAAAVLRSDGSKETRRIGVGAHTMAAAFEQPLQGIAHRLVVVDDMHEAPFLHPVHFLIPPAAG